MKARRLILLATVSFIVVLIANAPARLVSLFLPPAVVMDGLEGTIWSGSARQLVVEDRAAGELAWTLRPSRLLTGRLGIDIDSKLPDGSLSGRLALGMGGSVRVTDLRGSLPVGYVATDFPPGMIDGRVSLIVEEAELIDGWPTRINGVVALGNLVQNVPKTIALGTFAADFDGTSSEATPVVGRISTRSGPLNVEGTLSLSNDRRYELDASVRATDSTPADIKQVMPLIGEQQADGAYRLRFAGAFKNR